MVSRSICSLALACLTVSLGCGGSMGDENGEASTTRSTGTSTTSGSATTPASTSSPGTDAGDSGSGTSSATLPADSSSTTTTTGGDGDTSSSSADSGPLCPPAPPAGNECLECAHANCCAAWQLCMEDEPCACVVDCHVVQGNSLGMCSNTCDLDSDLYQGLYFCGQANCLGSCDWDCC